MSVCDPKSPSACVDCTSDLMLPAPSLVARPSDEEIENLEQLLAELRAIRLEARRLARSGNPAVAAEGKRALAQCREQILWIHSQLEDE